MARNVFGYKKINQIYLITKRNLKIKELIQKTKYNQRYSKIINFILFEITLITLPKTNRAFEPWIEIKVNKRGNNQILSDKYIGNLPSEIYINNNIPSSNFINKTIKITSINHIIRLKWNESISNFTYMFSNLDNIIYAKVNYKFEKDNNLSYMFYNCTSLENIIFDVDYNKNNIFVIYDDKNYSYPNDLRYTFYNCISLNNLEFNHLKTDFVEECNYMFFNCKNLQQLSLKDSIFSNNLITNMKGMFQNCESLSSLNLSSFYTPQVEIMWDMFKNCKSLQYLDISNFDTSKVTDMESMFEGCENLISLSIVNFKTPNVHYMNKMFFGCERLQTLYFNNINSESLGTMALMFYNCKSLKYLNIYSLTEKTQSISDMFKGASDNFIFCIKEKENIPNIIEEIYKNNDTKQDCSEDCYGIGNSRLAIAEKKICCPKFMYNGNCYNKCPPRMEVNESKICKNLTCDYWYNYNQDECINEIPPGFYENDTNLKTIDKCHENCKTCKKGPTETKEKCLSCKDDSLYLYFSNCIESCPDGKYINDSGILKCKCTTEECKDCTEESLEEDSCLECNEGYFPKLDDIPASPNYRKCFKDPPKYYFYPENQIYKPCYPSCENCYGDGNDDFHNCSKCGSNKIFAVKYLDKNCYENCKYYYYFDNDNKYKCTEKDECPDDFKFLIVELRQCVRSCNNALLPLSEYNKKLRYECYKECPLNISKPRKENLNSCRPICTYDFPFELVEEEKCVASCSIMERSKKLCITNYYGNRTNLEIQELIHIDIQKDLENKFDYAIITENQTVLIEENQTFYEIVTTRNKNPKSNITTIKLGECETRLKDYYKIEQDEYLYILVINAYIGGKTGPVNLYEVYYPLFNSEKLYKLDLSICEGLKISFLYNLKLRNPELYDKNNSIYNNMCSPYSSKNGVDMTLIDVQEEYKINNRSICDEGCEFSGYNNNQAECKCGITNSFPQISKLKIDKDKLYKFASIKNIANFGVLKCINLFHVKERMLSNIGIYSFIPTFISYIICLYLFYKRDFKIIKEKIKDLLYSIQNLKYLRKQHNKILINAKEPAIIKILKLKNIIRNENKYINSKNLSLRNDYSSSKRNFPIEKEKNEEFNQDPIFNNTLLNSDSNPKKDFALIRKKEKSSPPKRNSNFVYNRKIDKKTNIFKFKSIKDSSTSDRFYNKLSERESERIRQIIAYNDKELNELKFRKAVKYDNRNFIQIYYSFLKMDHLLIKILNSKDYNSLAIKIYLFFYNFSLSYTVNALFFNEGVIHQILEDEGKFNFLYQLPQILYSLVISYFFGIIIYYYALSEDNILELKAERVYKIALKKSKDLIRTLKQKFLYFFVLSFIFLLLFWYYLICFCVVYINTQFHLLKDSIIGYIMGLLTPFAGILIPVLLRVFGLKKKNNYLYLLSKMLHIFI